MDFETIACFGCETENETTNRFCTSCGAPLWAPLPQDATPEVPAPAYAIWKDATDEWKRALKAGEPDDQLWGHLESLLSLALSYAGSTPFPRAHAHLAIVLLTLGMDAGAEREANIALQQNPNEFRAQQVRIALALNGELTPEQPQSSSPALLYPGFESSEDMVSGEPSENPATGNFRLVEAGGVQCENSLVPSVVTEIERMLVIFRNFCDTNTDVEEYLNIADFLILSSDQIQDIPLDLRAELYSAVAYTPTDMLNCNEREREVVAVLQRARRELLALKHLPEQSTARRRVAFA